MKNWPIFSIQSRKRNALLFAVLSAAVLLAALLSISMGAVSISPWSVFRALVDRRTDAVETRIILYSRLPRTLGCLLVGMSLALSGAVIQSVLNNPLAAPNIIGVNSGAGLAVVLWSTFAPQLTAMIPFAAFLGALAGTLLVLLIAQRTGASRITLILSGVAVSNIFSAGIDGVVTLVPDALIGYSDFKIGGLANLSMTKIRPALWVVLIAAILLLALRTELDVLALGTETAQSLGLPVQSLRLLLLSLAAALAGAAVSVAGLLGFVGLIIPNMMRQLAGEESSVLLPACALGGAAFLTGCDLLSRLLFAPYELPVGVVLSLFGGPFFIWLLLRQRGGRIP